MSWSRLLLSDDGKCEILGGDLPEQSQDPCQEVSGPRVEDSLEAQREDDTAADSQRISKLDAFQEKQKLIEEQNQKKKEMLVRAINDRKKKTDSLHIQYPLSDSNNFSLPQILFALVHKTHSGCRSLFWYPG